MAEPTLEYRIRSKDESQAGIRSAADGLQNIEKQLHQVSRAASMLMGGGALGGIMLVFRRVTQAAAECEKSFIDLHPEMVNAEGSARTFGVAMDTVKARIGGAISGAISPLRQLFIDMVDPTANATQALKDYNAEFKTFMEKYSNAAIRAAEEYAQALADQKAKEIELSDAIAKRLQLTLDLTEAQKGATAAATPSPSLTPAMAAHRQVSASNEVATINANIALNNTRIEQLQKEIARNFDWIKNNPGGIPVKVKELATETISQGYRPFGYPVEPMRLPDTQSWITDLARAYREPTQNLQASITDLARAFREELIPNTQAWITDLARAYGAAKDGTKEQKRPSKFDKPESTYLDLSWLTDIAKRFTSLSMLLDWANTILTAMANTLGPVVDSVLAPFVGILVVLGNTIGLVLIPVFQALSPVIELLGWIFVAIYNFGIVPFGNAIILVANLLYNLGQVIRNIVTLNWGNLAAGTRAPDTGFLTPIDFNTLTSTGAAAITSASGATGGGASYTAARDITVNVGMIQINTDVITGEGGFRDLVLKIDKELEQCIALGLTA